LTLLKLIAGEKKVLDGFLELWYLLIMAKYIVKVNKSGNNFRINIPRQIVRLLGWNDTKFVIIDDQDVKTLTIRSLLDAESLESKDT